MTALVEQCDPREPARQSVKQLRACSIGWLIGREGLESQWPSPGEEILDRHTNSYTAQLTAGEDVGKLYRVTKVDADVVLLEL
eukprot:4162077-Amphidinium_carterae.1